MTFIGTFIDDASASSDRGVLSFELRLPWYRSLPISSIEALDVSVDGVAVPPDRLRIEVNGRDLTVAEAADLWEEYWFIQDPATVKVIDSTAAGLEAPEVDVHLALRSPYILIGPETALVVHSRKIHRFNSVARKDTAA